jgi:hypothetical protein
MNTTDPDTMSNGARLAEGIAIIISKEPDAEACATHDELFFGSCRKRYTKPERDRLEALGWRKSNDDSWAFFT